MLRRLVPAALATCLSATTAMAAPDRVRVETGEVGGVAGDQVVSFKGIPFAAPPVGPLRWRPPKPPKAWTGVRDGARFGASCLQPAGQPEAAPQSEDCLFLNVWRPAGDAKAALPVMMWIHGGGFVGGSSALPIYDGAAFARRGVVLVSINYRLGHFGFFGHPALTREAGSGLAGNYGLMDQMAALKWIRRNIAAFGGDPGRVTIFGESSGGGSVHMLLTSPLSRGLFAQAAIQSGGNGRDGVSPMRALHGPRKGAPVSAEDLGLALARQLGVEGTGPAALAALRALPAGRIVAAPNMLAIGGAQIYAGAPMIDGRLLAAPPEAVYRAGQQARVPLMIGSTSADIGIPAKTGIDGLFGADAAKARAAYDPSGQLDDAAILTLVGMDRVMTEPSRFVAAAYAKAGQPAFLYRFSYVPAARRAQWRGGLPHGQEIAFVFDTLDRQYGAAATEADRAAANAANLYWSNFAKAGDPNGSGLPPWPAYAARDVILDFTPDAGPRAEPDPWKARLDLTAALADRLAP